MYTCGGTAGPFATGLGAGRRPSGAFARDHVVRLARKCRIESRNQPRCAIFGAQLKAILERIGRLRVFGWNFRAEHCPVGLHFLPLPPLRLIHVPEVQVNPRQDRLQHLLRNRNRERQRRSWLECRRRRVGRFNCGNRGARRPSRRIPDRPSRIRRGLGGFR